MALRNLKIKYYGFLGLLGFLGFVQPAYFLFFLFFFFFVPPPKPSGEGGLSPATSDLIVKQAKEKEEHKNKILEMLRIKDKITNDDAQKLLGVSDATAERYLNELEKEGKIKQVDKEGQSVYYQKS